MICCFFSSFKTFAILREATYPPAAVNVLDVSSESMAAFQVFMYGRFWVFTEELMNDGGVLRGIVEHDSLEARAVDLGVRQIQSRGAIREIEVSGLASIVVESEERLVHGDLVCGHRRGVEGAFRLR